MSKTDYHALFRKLTGIDDKAPTPPQTGHDQASMKHFYIILAASLGIVLFGVVVAFLGLF